MRPKKKILLVGESEDSISTLKFALNTHSVYSVTVAPTALAAMKLLREQTTELFTLNPSAQAGRIYELLLCELPLAGVLDLLDEARILNPHMRSLVIGEIPAEILPLLNADVVYANRPYREKPSMAELLDRIRILTARKRGPRAAMKPPLADLGRIMAVDLRQMAGVS